MSKVEIELIPWHGDRTAGLDEHPTALLVGDLVIIDGWRTPGRDVEVTLCGFVEVRIKNPAPEMRARYTPEQFLWGTNGDLLILPVTELIVTQRTPMRATESPEAA